MTSEDVAGMVGSRHDNVTRDIRTMLDSLKFSTAEFSAMKMAGNGREYEVYNLPRDLTETLITGYSIPLRHKVVVRLRELEAEMVEPTVLSETLTMSSLEIAQLTGKRHGDVLRDIRLLLDAIGDVAELQHVQNIQDARGYTAEMRLPRAITETLVTGYSVPLRLVVIRRLHELVTELKVENPTFEPHRESRALESLNAGYNVPLRHEVVVRLLRYTFRRPSQPASQRYGTTMTGLLIAESDRHTPQKRARRHKQDAGFVGDHVG